MADRIVIIQGSPSDDAYAQQIQDEVKAYGIPVQRRTASAHRTSGHLDRILNQYGDGNVVFITIAGLSDALSGRVGADFSGRVIAAPPDAEKYGEMKVFSSTRTPTGIEIQYATTPQHAATLAVKTLLTYDRSRVGELRRQAEERKIQTIMHDAKQQGFEEPILPYTAFKRGKTRDVYQPDRDTLLIRGTDRISAFDVVFPERIPGKGESLTELAEYWFRLTQNLFPNHFLERVDERTIRVRKAGRVDIEWIVRGNIYGSLWRAYERGERALYGLTLPDGLQLAAEFPQPILTPTTKSETGHDEPITKEEAMAKGLVRDGKEWDVLAEATFELYRFYKQHAAERGILIPDFKLEFGRLPNGDYIQIDEPPNHDSARLWASQFYVPGRRQEEHALDKEFLRQYLIDGHKYQGDGTLPELPELVIDQVSRRCRGATEMLTGRQSDIAAFGLMTVEQVLEELRK